MFYLISVYQLCVIAIFVFFYNKIVFKKGLLNLSFLHYTYYFLFYFFGAGVLYIEGKFENNFYFFSATLYPLISLMGMYTVNFLRQNSKEDILVLKQKSVIFIYFLTIAIAFSYIASLDNIPLVYVLQGDSAAAAIARSLVTKEYEGPKFLYYSYRLIVDYALIFIAIHLYIKDEAVTKKLVFVLFIIAIIATADSQKYPVMNIFLMLFLAAFTFHRAKATHRADLRIFITYKTILVLVLAYLSIGFLWASVAGRLIDRPIMSQLESIVENANSMVEDRLLFGQNRVLYVTYEIVPKKYDYFYGKTFPNPLRLLPYEPVIFSYLTYDELHPESIGGKVRGSGPAVFYSVIYANFGIVISFFSMYLFGMFMQYVNNSLEYSNKYIIPYRFMWFSYITAFSLSIDSIYNSERFYFLLLMFFVLFSRKKSNC